ncbi:CHASE2 domain-containing protein [Maridesulfovibrio sp. FT414]|uniref:CHASE2 domain-containing protein n=1 Tax=Maridesulfovibrio sp. FT414 TaxID=2979469 RepID=UPI003D804D5C
MTSYALSGLRLKASLAALTVFLLLIGAMPLFPDFFSRMESALYDQRVRTAGPVPASPEIVLLDIDDASIRELGKWPWDRSVHARAIETLTRCETGLIAYDIVFHGHGSSKGDSALQEALKRNPRVLLPAGFSLTTEPKVVELDLDGLQNAVEKSVLKTSIPGIGDILQADRAFLPLQELADRAAAIGHISASPDSDGVLRRVPLAIGVNGRPLPAIGLEAAMRMLNISEVRWIPGSFQLKGKKLSFNIPVDAAGHMAINFSGKWGEGFTHLSFADVIAASGDPEAEGDLRLLVQGKTIIVGHTSSGSTDIGPTTVSGAEPLVTVHSNGINTILQQTFIRPAPVWVDLIIGAAMIGTICLLAFRFGPRRFVLAAGALIFLYAVANMSVFIIGGVVLNLSGVIYSSMCCFLVALGLKSLLLFAENEARRVEREKLQIQLDAAAKIQSHFWPRIPDLGNGDRIFAYSSPALFVGGDLYDIIPLEDGSWIIYLADVSGKGLPAALVMASAWTQIRSSAARNSEPDKLLEAVNRNLYPFLERNSNFVTILLLRYFPDSGRMQWVNGGHMKPLILGPEGVREVTGITNMPVGIFDEAEYHMEETTLEPGESCIMMSDGVTEAEDIDKQLFGEERVTTALLESPPETRGEVLAEAVRKWRNGKEQNDDTTIVEVMRR